MGADRDGGRFSGGGRFLTAGSDRLAQASEAFLWVLRGTPTDVR